MNTDDPDAIITTTLGPMQRKYLRKRVSVTNNERETTEVVEYLLADQVVHRSATINLKQCLGIEGMLGQLR